MGKGLDLLYTHVGRGASIIQCVQQGRLFSYMAKIPHTNFPATFHIFSELYTVISQGLQQVAKVSTASSAEEIEYSMTMLSLLQQMTHAAAASTRLSLHKHT